MRKGKEGTVSNAMGPHYGLLHGKSVRCRSEEGGRLVEGWTAMVGFHPAYLELNQTSDFVHSARTACNTPPRGLSDSVTKSSMVLGQSLTGWLIEFSRDQGSSKRPALLKKKTGANFCSALGQAEL